MKEFNILETQDSIGRKQFKLWHKTTVVLILLTTLILAVFQVIQIRKLISFKNRIAIIQNQNSTNKTEQSYNDISSSQNDVFKIIRKIQKWENPAVDVYYVMNDIAAAITPKTALEQINYDKKGIIINGISKSLSDFQSFLENLNSLSWAHIAKLSKLNSNDAHLHVFEVVVEFKNEKKD